MSRGAAAARRGLPQATPGVSAQADRRFRRRDSRPSHYRWRKVAWRAAAFGGAGLLVLVVLVAVGAAVLRSPLLMVEHLVVRGNSRLSDGEVEALLDGLRGQSILLVDFDEYRKRLMDSPWVAGVTLARVLPATVNVSIVERSPLAVARLGQQLYLVDDQGVIIDEFGPEYREFDLPIVDGLVRLPHADGPMVDQAGVRVTGRFLEALRSQPTLRRRVSQIDVTDPHDLVVLLDDDAALLHVGDTRFVERLSMYLQIAPTLRGQMKDIDYVDLRLDDLERVIVRSKAGDE
jgi:cell division protein FtsQ